MSKRNGDRSRSNAQRRHKAKLRARRRELLPGRTQPFQKVTAIDSKKKDSDEAKVDRL